MTQTFFDDGDFHNTYDGEVKKCRKCNDVKPLDKYYKNSKNIDGYHNYCKECMAKNDHKRYENNVEKFAAHHQEYKTRGRDVILEGRKRYYQRIKVKHYQYIKDYRKTPSGQKIQRLAYARRKKYGFAPLNEPFDGAEFHHLHRDLDGNVDHSIGIYIPSEIHQRLYHNHKTWQGMDEMNKIAIEWYISTL